MAATRKFRRTTLCMVLLAGFLIGLAAARKWPDVPWFLVLLLPIGVMQIRRRSVQFAIGLAVAGLLLGWWRGANFRQQLLPYQNLYGQPTVMQVTARTDGIYSNQGNLSFDAGGVTIREPFQARLPGVIKVETIGLPAVFRNDRLELSGKLYPAGGSRQGSMRYAKAMVIETDLNWLERLRLRFSAAVQTVLPEPHASFGLGILVGQRSTLPAEVSDALSRVGLTHIIAVSGYNLTVIVRSVNRKLSQRSKYQAFILSAGLVSMFVLITGFSASIVRAAVVCAFSLGAWYYGRTFKPLLIILMAAAVTAGWNPVYLWADIGWYLSFLAFFGVLILAPLVTRLFWRRREPRGLMPLVIESGCAQIMAAPLIMHIFEEGSTVALLSNLLIVPLVPVAMLLTFAGGVAGILLPAGGALVAWPAKIMLGYMLQVVDLLSRVPHAIIERRLSLQVLVAGYTLIVVSAWWVWFRMKLSYGNITDKTRHF